VRFSVGVTLRRPEAFDRIISAKESKKLPVVLSGAEIVHFLQAVPWLPSRAALTTTMVRGCACPRWQPSRLATSTGARMVIRRPLCYAVTQLLRMLGGYWRLARPAARPIGSRHGRQGNRPVYTVRGSLPPGRSRGGSGQASPRSHAAPLLRHTPEAGTDICIILCCSPMADWRRRPSMHASRRCIGGTASPLALLISR